MFPSKSLRYHCARRRTLNPWIASLGVSFLFTLLALCAHANTSRNNEPKQSLKVLYIGDNFSNTALSFLPQFAEAGGKELLLAGVTHSSGTLERHARHLSESKYGLASGNAYVPHENLGLQDDQTNITLSEALAAQEWDIITIQQALSLSFYERTYERPIQPLVVEIKRIAPKATVFIHQTWPYRSDHPQLKRANISAKEMQEFSANACETMRRWYHLELIPSGSAVWAALQTGEWSHALDPNYDYDNPPAGVSPKENGLYIGNRWRIRNGQPRLTTEAADLNTAGCYLVSAVWYEVLFQDSVLNINLTPEGLSAAQSADLRRIAHQTVTAVQAKKNSPRR